MDELATMLQQAGDAAPSAPASDPSGTGGAAPATTGGGSAPAGQPAADDLPTSVREYLAAHPDHKDVVDLVTRETRSAWTPKLQEAAETRKLIEGLSPQEIQQLRQLKAAQQQNPQAVAQYLRQYADSLVPQVPDPYNGVQPTTEAERLALSKLQELDQWRHQQEQLTQRQQLEQFAAHATQEFARIANEYQITIPNEVLQAAGTFAHANKIPVENALWAVNPQLMREAVERRTRDQVAGVVQQKTQQAAGNPGSISTREGEPGPRKDRSLRSFIAEELANSAAT
jgi:hypothetical protein